ncbi:MAG: hypothetical protein U0670_25040 [Anaerolineae bacterium]
MTVTLLPIRRNACPNSNHSRRPSKSGERAAFLVIVKMSLSSAPTSFAAHVDLHRAARAGVDEHMMAQRRSHRVRR